MVGLDPIPGTLSTKHENTMNGTPCTHTFSLLGNLDEPVHLLAYCWEVQCVAKSLWTPTSHHRTSYVSLCKTVTTKLKAHKHLCML